MEIYHYSSVQKFFESLDEHQRAKIDLYLLKLETYSYLLSMPFSKMIARNLFELRITSNPPIRLFYSFYDDRAIILHGFVKKTQKTPKKEIKLALSRLKRLTLK